MRNAFIDELVQQAKLNSSIALVVGDLGFSVVEPFADQFPDRFINAGVAEQNMMGLAAGMASEGYHVFVYSIANFPTFRCAEQIRNDVDYQNLPVTVVSVGGGLSYGALGYSHHAVQDYALLRSMPNMLIASPGDPLEVRQCLKYLVKEPRPSYLRIGKAGEPTIHAKPPRVLAGEWVPVSLCVDGHQRAKVLLTTGAVLPFALTLQKKPEYRDYSVYSLPLWGMTCKETQLAQVGMATDVITIEDHLRDGGFGSWLVEAMDNRADLSSKIKSMALKSSVCGQVGSQSTLNAIGGLG